MLYIYKLISKTILFYNGCFLKEKRTLLINLNSNKIMTKKLLLLCAVVMMCVGRIAAQNEWHVVADNQYYVPVSEVAYMLFTDDSEEFAIVKTDGEMMVGVSEVTFSQSVPESVEGVDAERLAVTLFPNPVTSELRLQGLRENAQARVLSLDGALLIEATLTPNNGRIDVSALAAGVYLLQVNETTVKFLKK